METSNNNSQSTVNSANQAVLEFMRTRRSVPAKLMVGPGPNEKQLRDILEIAARVPDHGKLAPWRFVRYSHAKCDDLGKKILARAQAIAAEKGETLSAENTAIERNRFNRGAVVIAVISCAKPHPKIPEWEQVLSSGAVAMNMLIAANANGFDAQWLTEWLAFDDSLRIELGLETGEKVAGFIHIGTRQDPKTERGRPVLDDIYTEMDL